MGITESWRSKRLHRKCIFCVFSKLEFPKCHDIPSEWKCLCKDKSVLPTIIRPFCKCFRIDKDACEEIDKGFYLGSTPSEAKKDIINKL